MPYCSVNEAWGRDFGSQIQQQKETFPVNDNLEKVHKNIDSEYPLLAKHLSNQNERNIENIDKHPELFADPYESDDNLDGEEYSDLFNGEPLVNANIKEGNNMNRQYEEGVSKYIDSEEGQYNKAPIRKLDTQDNLLKKRRTLDLQVEDYLNLLNRKIKRLEDKLSKSEDSFIKKTKKSFGKNILFYLLVIAICCLLVDIGVRIFLFYKNRSLRQPVMSSSLPPSMTSSMPTPTPPPMFGGSGNSGEKMPKFFMHPGPRFHPHYYHTGFHYT